MTRRFLAALYAPVLATGAAACDNSTDAIDEEPVTSLISVTPEGGTTGVDPNTTIVLEFSHAMGMEIYAALHEGDGVDGPLVDGAWSWSDDGTRLTFTPTVPLKSLTPYTIHMGGGMTDDHGHVIDLEQHGHDMGGEWATEQMMQHRMMQGGMMMGDDMMGPGWQHPTNGTYGMLFTFTTA